jgi:branched-chain amino acid transport system substrate-binding protein
VATIVPWESWYFGRGAKPGTTFTYTTMFFFGIPEFGECFIPMWNRIHNNKQVALMYPNDADGNAFRDAKTGFPPLMHKAGYKTTDGGAYADGTTDYSAMISKFKSHDCEIFSNAPIPPDFNTMWKQSAQQGFKPKLATVAKVLLFPSDVTALGSLALNVATDAWWTPYHKQTPHWSRTCPPSSWPTTSRRRAASSGCSRWVRRTRCTRWRTTRSAR